MILHSLTFMVDPTINVRAKSINIIITPNSHTFGGIGSSIYNSNQYNY